jgi:hypothetical protein
MYLTFRRLRHCDATCAGQARDIGSWADGTSSVDDRSTEDLDRLQE